MDLHLKNLFGRFQDQFGTGPGLGPGSGVCLMKVEGTSSNIVQSIFRASASLYRSEPWKRLRPGHLFGVRVGKDSDWSGKRQPFQCVQFIGGDGGDIAFYMYRSMSYALKMTDDSWEITRVPNAEVLRVTYELESLMFPSNKRMVKSLSLEVSGTDRFPVIDVARCTTSGELQFRSPTLEELRLVFAVMKALSLVHPLLLEEEMQVRGLPRMIKFSPFIETVDVQWPPEMFKGHDFVAVTVSHPPGQSYEQKSKKNVMAHEDEAMDLVSGMTNLRVGNNGEEAGLSRCTMCEKAVHRGECVCCSHCRATIYCGSDCEKRHWREMHRSVCSLYEAMMSREEELKLKIFTFSCYAENTCEWLGSLGIHKKGMWRRQCSCYSHQPFGLLHCFSSDAQSESWGGLEEGDSPQDLPIQNLNNGRSPGLILISDWSDYYDLRCLPRSSPVADILCYPLTLYHILTSVSTHSKNLLLKGKEVTVHYLGPERELDWIKAFAEINHLLNGLGTVQIIMIGPEVPSDLSGTIATTSTINSRVKLSFVKGLYQEEVTYLISPDIIVALNCDLDGYSSWAGAVETMNNMGIPGFFTDKTEEACGNAKAVLRNAGLSTSHPVAPNPFRSPVRTCAKSSNLPCYSNGFILGVNT
ncbi:PREDICTED: zinc finger MYND domain-containing protein 15-like [Camelina sativa]|uniref:Zinc finger MYND domain-containing protein 15-like n=1 Tax=Camelina sativa TaxID=90675 RepID=A0ABM0UD46_CAMSA|nr:PREDICTED: zinc finger MYND domain-containing protein 15-like [Camelina sativa]